MSAMPAWPPGEGDRAGLGQVAPGWVVHIPFLHVDHDWIYLRIPKLPGHQGRGVVDDKLVLAQCRNGAGDILARSVLVRRRASEAGWT